MQEYVRFTARLPLDVAEWLKERAAEQSRSMNGQLTESLKDLMKKEGRK